MSNLEQNLIFKTIVGSQAFGTNTPESDIDYCGVYQQPTKDIFGFNYIEQEKVTKDEYYYEVKRFLQLLSEAKPNALELLFSPNDCIVHKDPLFDLIIEQRDIFITQQCYKSFGNYALAQISKAKGLNKKMNWERSRTEKKTPLDFSYVTVDGKTIPLIKFLEESSFKQENCGLVRLDHFKDCYSLYYDGSGTIGFRGIIKEDSDEVRTSSVPKGMLMYVVVYYNKDGYTQHCADYKSYKQWLDERNTQRYTDNAAHGQEYDSKNMMHCRRLLDMAIEIAKDGVINIRRPNVDYLLEIKKGKVPLVDILSKAEEDIKGLQGLYEKSSLPVEVDKNKVNDLLIKLREYKFDTERYG